MFVSWAKMPTGHGHFSVSIPSQTKLLLLISTICSENFWPLSTYFYVYAWTVDTRLNQTDSVATSNAKTQARQSLVYNQFNEENCWTKSNNLLGESLLSVTEVSFSWSACRNFSHLRNQPPPPPLTELEKLRTITNYQQASTTLSPTPKVEGKTFANFANFNFCLTFNFLRVQPGHSSGLGRPRNNTQHREPKK